LRAGTFSSETLMDTVQHVHEAPASLAQLFKQIDTEAIELDKRTKHTLKQRIRLGILLLKAKTMVPHGQWLDCLKANYRFSAATATRAMRCAEKFAGVNIDLLTHEEAESDGQIVHDDEFEDEPPDFSNNSVSENTAARADAPFDGLTNSSVQPPPTNGD